MQPPFVWTVNSQHNHTEEQHFLKFRAHLCTCIYTVQTEIGQIERADCNAVCRRPIFVFLNLILYTWMIFAHRLCNDQEEKLPFCWHYAYIIMLTDSINAMVLQTEMWTQWGWKKPIVYLANVHSRVYQLVLNQLGQTKWPHLLKITGGW